MNNLFFSIGRLTNDIELRKTKNDKSVVELSIAINNGENDTTYIKIQVFGAMAETVNKFCKKGDLIGVRGIIKNNNWQDKDGKKHYDYQFIAERVIFLNIKGKKEEVKDIPQNSKTEYDDIKSDIKLEDDDLPF